jgi:hypothetical protein
LHVEKRRPAPLIGRRAANGAADEEETTMANHLVHDEQTPRELAGGRA